MKRLENPCRRAFVSSAAAAIAIAAFFAAASTTILAAGLQEADPADVSAVVPLPKPDESTPPIRQLDFTSATAALSQHCADCHGNNEGKGGFRLETIAAPDSLAAQFGLWHRVRSRISDGSMPPSDAEPLIPDERESLSRWIENASLDAVCGQSPSVGPPMLRRMTRVEYANTIRDLMEVHFNVASLLPEDMAGGEGFTNASETLIISPIHAERYLDAATEAVGYALSDSSSRELVFPVQPSGDRTPSDSTRQNIRRFAERAFRRPVVDQELTAYFHVCDREIKSGAPTDTAVAQAIKGILMSPQFLFLSESAPVTTGSPEQLTDHELATRLSYFLWTTLPDDKLRQDADAGRLKEPDVLKSHVERMIKHRGTHLQDSMSEFVGQWLGTADLGVSRHVDRDKHRFLADPHVAGLRNQPVYFFEELLQSNESLLQLIDSDWTFLNEEVSRVYGMDRKKLKKEFVQNLVRVPLPEEYRNRGGLLAMGGVHAVASYPRRSSPVLRGTWVLERLMGVELPPPPPDVPALDDAAEVVAAKTMRQRLELHRANPSCATCHDRIDPIGFAMENFDEIGRWRDLDAGSPIDAVTITSDGRTINGIDGLKAWLLDHRREFLTQLTRKMLGYALARSLRPTDLCTVRTIVDRLEKEDYKAQSLVLGIVESQVFQMKQ